MRAGFELYRAFDRDAEDNRAALKRTGKLTVPTLAIGGDASFFAPLAKPMLREVAKEVTIASIPQCGHWIANEQLVVLVKKLLEFTQ